MLLEFYSPPPPTVDRSCYVPGVAGASASDFSLCPAFVVAIFLTSPSPSLSCQMSRHREAIAESSRALSDDPTYTKAYERRAASLFDLGECRIRGGPLPPSLPPLPPRRRSVGWLGGRAIGRSVGWLGCRSVCQLGPSVGWSFDRSVVLPVRQSVCRSVGRSMDGSVSRSVCRWVGGSSRRSFGRTISLYNYQVFTTRVVFVLYC